MFFSKKLREDIKKLDETIEELKKETETEEEWIWVEGYKGTDKNMCCRDFQYELGKRYDMPEDATIKACESGFHLCLNMRDVREYYPIGEGRRFFRVRALVRKKEFNDYGGWTYSFYEKHIDKLTSKAIEFVSELTMDEILENTRAANWDNHYKQMAIEKGLRDAEHEMMRDTLVGLGYSLPFTNYIIDSRKYEAARAVGSQEDLSMDMKALIIFTS